MHTNVQKRLLEFTILRKKKNDKYRDFVDDGYLFQPPAFKIQGAAGPSSEICLNKFCKNLSICAEEIRACSFFKQRISLAIQIALVYYIFSCPVACSFEET